MNSGGLGRTYHQGEVIVKQGEPGDCMYVIQQGEVEVILEKEEGDVILCTLRENDFFGEMAIFNKKPRSATVRALGDARVLSVDKKNFLSRVHDDPSIAFRLVQTLSRRIQDMDEQVGRTHRDTA
ncbi:MAG TPA: cyclic nucleotide-binding domain-containing protein [Chloroflexota bacterium]